MIDMDMQHVILVDENDVALGSLEKMEAHRTGALHRAFSVFIFNSYGEMLLQQRALNKYHSPGLWSNACCSHPRPGEETAAAAQRRLSEELGFTVDLEKVFDFVYRINLENGLIEHEFDHVFAGVYNSEVIFNYEEVQAVTFRDLASIREDLDADPSRFTAWFHLAFPAVEKWWFHNYVSKTG